MSASSGRAEPAVQLVFQGPGQFFLSFEMGLGLHALCSRTLVVQSLARHATPLDACVQALVSAASRGSVRIRACTPLSLCQAFGKPTALQGKSALTVVLTAQAQQI